MFKLQNLVHMWTSFERNSNLSLQIRYDGCHDVTYRQS